MRDAESTAVPDNKLNFERRVARLYRHPGNARIASAQGRVVWSLEAYGFFFAAGGRRLPRGRPSLWLQSRLNMNHRTFFLVGGPASLKCELARHCHMTLMVVRARE